MTDVKRSDAAPAHCFSRPVPLTGALERLRHQRAMSQEARRRLPVVFVVAAMLLVRHTVASG